MPFMGALTGGLIAGAGSLFGGLFGSSAAKKASQQQVQAEQQALDFQKQVYAQQQQNLQPFIQGGSQSFENLLNAINAGTFGPGSIPLPAAFRAPTYAEAMAEPGYQFQQQQGQKGILAGAAGAGGALSGGTLKQLAEYNQRLAGANYQNVFNRALSTYGTGLEGYQAALQGQQQAYQQMLAPAQMGLGAAGTAGQLGSQASQIIGGTLGNIGGAQAAGTIGSASAISGMLGNLGNIAMGLGLTKAYGAGPQGQLPPVNPQGPY